MSRPFSTENVFRALAHRTRQQILESLRKRDHFAGELLNGADLRAPTLSEHLRVLRQLGLVSCKRQGNKMVYRLNTSPLRDAAKWLATFERRAASKNKSAD